MSITSLELQFKLEAPRAPTIGNLSLSFALSPPDPTIFVWDGMVWQPSAQRVWTTQWFPPL